MRKVPSSVLWLAATAAFAFSVDVRGAEESKPPNILFIYTDDQSYRTLASYDGAWPWVKTPNIDRLAREGMRFTTAYGAAWCSPSRACVLSGCLPHGVQGVRLQGVYTKQPACDRNVCQFWPALLRMNGYLTAMIGKWHLGNDAGHGWLWDHSVVWDQNEPQGDWYNDQPLRIDGAAAKVVPGYSTDLYSQFAVDFIKRKHDRPWAIWLCYNAPHLPNSVHPRHKNLYQKAEVPIPSDIFGPRVGKPEYMVNYTQWQKQDEKEKKGSPVTALPETVRAYNRLVAAVDDGVGKILQELAESGQLDNTLIIFTSDQGFAWGEHGFRWKVGPYDACLKMPLIFRLPGRVAANAVCNQPATVVDLAPTLLDFAGVKTDWTMHGKSLRPLLRDPKTPWDRPVMMENTQWRFGAETERGLTGKDYLGSVPWWIFVRQGKYKYIRTLVENEIEELYDLEADPQEMQNLAAAPPHRTGVQDYRERLLAELRRTKAALVTNLPQPRVADEPAVDPVLESVSFGKERVDFMDYPGPDAAAPAVVLIHGGQCTAEDWATVAPRLAKRYRVIVPDGFVDPLDAWRLWLLLDHLKISRTALLGHSAGGAVIRDMYRLAPKRVWAMIDIDGGAFGPLTLARNLPHDRYSPAAAALYEKNKAQMQQLRPHHQGDYPSLVTIQRRLTAYKRSKIPPEARAAARKIEKVVKLPMAPPAPAAIPDQGNFILCPCLQIQTGRGKLRRADFGPEWVQKNFQASNIRYELIEESGHWPWLENLDSFLALLEPFLASHANEANHPQGE